jgi:hypothetical protein
MQRLTARKTPGAALTPAEVRALWTLRLQFMHLKEHVSPENDWDHFASKVRCSTSVVRFFAGGGVRGFYILNHEPRVHEGVEYIAFLPDYGFMERSYRRSPQFLLSMLAEILKCKVRHRLTPIYFMGITYPASFVSLCNNAPLVWTLHDEGIPAWERDVLLQFARAAGEAIQSSDGLINMPTRPKESVFGYRSSCPAWERYMEINPNWREGIGCPVIVPLTGKVVPFLLQKALSRHLATARRMTLKASEAEIWFRAG